MTIFLIKSSLSLVVLLSVYYLFLEKEKMHHFNRYYLLFGLLFSLAIPFFSFEIIEKIQSPLSSINNIQLPQTIITNTSKTNNIVLLTWIIYGLITTLLSIRFMLNLKQIQTTIQSHPTIKYKNAKLVLLDKKVLPHTFLNYIFINKKEYETEQIENELFIHELTHVSGKHSWDILFVEILKTVFWFNPLFIIYKKAIQLNHEFISDEKVIQTHTNVPFYQSLLLSKGNENTTFYLASNLNFLITKKRLIMMTKQKSTRIILLKQMSIVPLFLVLLLFSCHKNTETIENLSKAGQTVLRHPSTTKTNPEFKGGIEAFYKFIGENYQIPKGFKGKGKIYMKFMVEKDGNLSEFEIIKDDEFGLGKEAIRVLKMCPNWTPATENGKPVRVQYSLPITIQE
ncbi:M56 family metallopeptidase [Flavobacterium sp.]|uniref:M56 family metallopeptidase n=1 Tax=Flavobacterium sp. TaxID=239 RepID=UPI00286EEC14|nr:M56 family metallopeptidase [Flavobacterium sp.]